MNGLVWQYAYDQELFFGHFAGTIVKVGSIGVLTGADGEVRHAGRYVYFYFHENSMYFSVLCNNSGIVLLNCFVAN